MKKTLVAEMNGYRGKTPSALKLIPYKPCFHCAILPPGTKSPKKLKDDWRSSQAGRLTSSLSAFMSPLMTK